MTRTAGKLLRRRRQRKVTENEQGPLCVLNKDGLRGVFENGYIGFFFMKTQFIRCGSRLPSTRIVFNVVISK